MLHFPTIMFIFFLMWVGASPASTGGGIKTSTIAIATLNFISVARQKERVELFRRQVSSLSVQRAFSIICLSLIVIGFAVFMLSVFEKEKHLLPIAFECFSAYGTVGLSLGITASLTDASKVVIILTMFVGRVGMLTILIAILKKARRIKYQYPTEAILIN
jgi:Trk-type K+ transport system membrane component